MSSYRWMLTHKELTDLVDALRSMIGYVESDIVGTENKDLTGGELTKAKEILAYYETDHLSDTHE